MTEKECIDIVNSLKKCGINFLAVDFDMTLISIHTAGHWRGLKEELAVKIRPFFRLLIPLAIDHGIMVAIVTFSSQAQLISSVIHHGFPAIADRITIRAGDNSWAYQGGGSKDGKQSHMASAAEELGDLHGVSITRKSTLLVDDDANNIQIALLNKVRAIRFVVDDPQKTVDNLMSLKDLYCS